MRNNAVGITPADLPEDWTGWMVEITKHTFDGSFELTRGPVRSLSALLGETPVTVVLLCEWLERRGSPDPATGKYPWTRLGSAKYRTQVDRFTLDRDPQGVIVLWSMLLDETFQFSPSAAPDRTE